MNLNVYNLQGEVIDSVTVSDSTFGITDIAPDIIKTVIDWQLAKRRLGSHKTKTVSDISGTTKKPFAQKGTGRARQGSLRSPQMRGGGTMHGPVNRSHAIELPKKVRKLGLKHVLSSKVISGKLFVFNNLDIEAPKTSFAAEVLKKMNLLSCVMVVDNNDNFTLAARNIKNTVVLPQVGVNVYDLVKYDNVVITLSSLQALEARLQ
ncbi:MAG: 50S ribosomal protein L4 [Rickettsiaceae bacterium]|nr:50S ribosomal protein L4 [Rickettsiaceae bacterium]